MGKRTLTVRLSDKAHQLLDEAVKLSGETRGALLNAFIEQRFAADLEAYKRYLAAPPHPEAPAPQPAGHVS